MSDWIRVNKRNPCFCCGGDTWCSYLVDGTVHCMRTPSDKPCKGGGWIHRIDGNVPIVKYLTGTCKRNSERLSATLVAELAAKMYEHPLAEKKRSEVAQVLGLYAWALDRLFVGYGKDHRGEFASFPSRDENSKVIGITRRYGDGSKLTYPGTSNSGLFYNLHWSDNDGYLLIVEGGSDVAACVSEGICAIGRPSNIGGSNRIASMVRQVSWTRKVIVVCENDAKPEKRGVAPGCSKNCRCCPQCYPGLYGAKTVAMELNKLGVKAVVKMPRFAKDAREMYKADTLRDWAAS